MARRSKAPPNLIVQTSCRIAMSRIHILQPGRCNLLRKRETDNVRPSQTPCFAVKRGGGALSADDAYPPDAGISTWTAPSGPSQRRKGKTRSTRYPGKGPRVSTAFSSCTHHQLLPGVGRYVL